MPPAITVAYPDHLICTCGARTAVSRMRSRLAVQLRRMRCAASAVPCRHSGASAPPDSAAPPRHAAHQKMPRRTPVTRLSVLPSTDGYSWVAKGRGRASVRCREDIEPYSVLCRAFYKCNHAGFLAAPKSPSYESTGTAKKGNRRQPTSQNEPRRGCAGTPFPVLPTRLQHSRTHMIAHAHARRRNDCV